MHVSAGNQPIRILLLEDSDLDAELIGEQIAQANIPHEIHRVLQGDEFAAAASERCYDVILADYVLPTFDGLAALAVARERCPHIPFVFVSGTLGEDVAVEAIKGGATDYVTKQRLDRLPRTILRAISESKAKAERERAEQALRDLNETLEQRVAQRTAELEATNRELRIQITERARVEAALQQAQRLEAVGQLTSGVAHDFNNLLTVILGNAQFLERSLAGASEKRRLSMMRAAAERGAKLTEQLLAFSRRQRLDPKPIDLNETVAGMRDLLQSTMGGSVRIETVLSPDLWPAMVDPTQLELVILNLAINARDAMAVGGNLIVETANVRRGPPRRPEQPPAGDYIMISVTDTGTGISDEVLPKVFEPFFTTKEVGKGSGLGLAQVFGFTKQSGGGVQIDTRVGEGTSVKVFIPRAKVAAGSEPKAGVVLTRAAGTQHPAILLVDDDSLVREVTKNLLEDLGYSVSEAGSGQAALGVLQHEDREFDLLLVDFAMPGMNGAEVAREVRRLRPELPILFMTGYVDMAALSQAGEVGESQIVQKPFRQDELGRKVRAALSGPGPSNVVAFRSA